MNSDTIFDHLREILGRLEGFRPAIAAAELRREHRLVADLGVDSVSLLDLALALEGRLGRAVDEASLARLETLGAIADLLAGSP